MKLIEILKDTNYKLTQFSEEHIADFEKNIIVKETKGKQTPYVVCAIRNKEIKLTPEEVVRQLYVKFLMQDLNYPKDRIVLEYEVTFGREKKRADIVILDKDNITSAYIIVEVKSPKAKDGKEQLRSYCNATGSPIAVWTNGDSISYYHRKDPNYFEPITNIPSATQKLSDIFNEKYTFNDLIMMDVLVKQNKSLKDLI